MTRVGEVHKACSRGERALRAELEPTDARARFVVRVLRSPRHGTSGLVAAWLARIAFALSLAVAADARAQPRGDPALAEALFQEGAALMDGGHCPAALPKLRESQSLDPALGTLLRLALCHETTGKTATAWAEFQEAVAWAARMRHQDRVALAEDHIRALTPRLSTLTLVVSPQVSRLPGLAIRNNGASVGRATFGVKAPVDPGSYTIEVEATGHEPWHETVTVADGGDHQVVQIPALRRSNAPLPAPVRAAVGPQPSSSGISRHPGSAERGRTSSASDGRVPTRRWVGYAVGGVGVLAVGVGSYVGFKAVRLFQQAKNKCPDSPCADREGVNESRRAMDWAWASTFGIGLGVAALGAGGYLVVSSFPAGSPDASTSGFNLVPGIDGIRLTAGGTL